MVTITGTNITVNECCSSQPRARASITALQAIATGVNQPLTFDTNIYDTTGGLIHVAGSANFVVPVGMGGVWQAWGQVVFDTINTQAQRGFGVSVNGNVNTQDMTNFLYGAIYSVILPINDILVLNAGDYVQFSCWQGTGVPMNVRPGCFGALMRIGSA